MYRRGALIFALFLLVVAIFLLFPPSLLAIGGHGTGITFPAGPQSSEATIDTTFNFAPYHHSSEERIQYDFNLLLSPVVLSRIGAVVGDTEQAVDDLLWELDGLWDNEFGLPYHDFALIYNYFARPDYPYGQRPGEDPSNVLFNLGYPDSSEENHVDFYLAGNEAELPGDWTTCVGLYPSGFWDWDEDSTSTITAYHFNSLQGYDGPYGLDAGNPNWYKSGRACNLRFNHEYQHMCFRSNTGMQSTGWPNEFFSTAAEYLSGVAPDSSYLWQLQYDLPCGQSLLGQGYDALNPYGMWRLFAVYLLQQFNTDESSYEDDLLYQWLRAVTQSYTADRGMYQLGEVLIDPTKPWHTKLAPGDSTRMGKLCALFQDWSIAKALDDTTRIAPGDSVTLGFGRGFSPYQDLGLFRDIDLGAPNSGVLPNEHVLDSTWVNRGAWVTQYRHPSDSLWTGPPAADTSITLRAWGADYILFKSTYNFQSGSDGPCSLKVFVRQPEGQDDVLPLGPYGQRLQVSVITYSSAEHVFQSGEDVIDVKKLDVPAGSGQVNIAVEEFGDSVKAALVILGLTGRDPDPSGDDYSEWDYRYAYEVVPYWTHGSISGDFIWMDTIRVNGNVTVEASADLAVEPGTYVSIAEACSLRVAGDLNAVGSPGEPIRFVPAAQSPEPGDWAGIYCSGNLEMKCCSLKYGDVGVIVSDSGSVALDSCWITSCAEHVIDVIGVGSELVASNSILESFNSDTGVRATDYGTLTLDNCDLNTGVRVGDYAEVRLENCTVSGDGDYGIDLTGVDGVLEVTNTSLEGENVEAGVEMGQGAIAHLNNFSIAGHPRCGVNMPGEASSAYLTDCSMVGCEEYGLNASGESSLFEIVGSDIGVSRKNSVGVFLSQGSHGSISTTTISGDADSLTCGIKGYGVMETVGLCLDSVTVSDHEYGLRCAYTDLYADGCRLLDISNTGLQFFGALACTCSVKGSSFDMTGAGTTGIYVQYCLADTLVGDSVRCSAGGGECGIDLVGVSETVRGRTTVENVFVSGFQNGLRAEYESLTVAHGVFRDFTNDGIKISKSDVYLSYDTLDVGSTGVSGIELLSCLVVDVNHNVITGSSSGLRYGIKSSGITSGSVSYNRIENVLAGMKVYGSSDLQVERNVFADNGTVGISVEGSAEVGIKRNSITDYTYFGVVVKNSAHADMGAQPDSGVNRIFTDSQLVGRYWVMNRTADSVKAEYNWWGTDDPYFLMLFYGKVDWVPFLTQDPGMPFALRMPGRTLATPAAGYAVQNYPNPMNPVTTIEYGVPEDGTHVLVRVFDVSGRLVKTLVEGRELQGVHTVSWDGRGEDNRSVASGVYVYEAVIGRQRVTKKLVVLK